MQFSIIIKLYVMLEYKLFYEEEHELPTLEGLTPYWCDEDNCWTL
jgi:hypothetical protein